MTEVAGGGFSDKGAGGKKFESVLQHHAILRLLANGYSRRQKQLVGSRVFGKQLNDLLNVTPEILELARSFLGSRTIPIRGVFFDKNYDANWCVGWHQDRVLPVELTGKASTDIVYSRKGGVLHIEVPEAIMPNLLTLKVLLDDCEEASGPQRFINGSHSLGRLSAAQALEVGKKGISTPCTGRAGDVWVLAYSLVHSSARSQTSKSRRILHIDFANCPAPTPFEWFA